MMLANPIRVLLCPKAAELELHCVENIIMPRRYTPMTPRRSAMASVDELAARTVRTLAKTSGTSAPSLTRSLGLLLAPRNESRGMHGHFVLGDGEWQAT